MTSYIMRFWPARALLAALGLGLLIACAAQPQLMREGIALEKSGRHAEAISLYRTAVDSGKLKESVAAPRIAAASRALASSLVQEGFRLLDQGKVKQALQAATDARLYAPEDEDVDELFRVLGAAFVENASNLVEAGKHLEAVRLLNSLLEVNPRDGQVGGIRDELMLELSERLVNDARDFDSQGLSGNALVNYLILKGLYPEREEIASEVRRRRQALMEQMKLPVIFELSARGDLGRMVEEAMPGLTFKSKTLLLQLGQPTPDSLHLQLSNLKGSIIEDVEYSNEVKAVQDGSRPETNPDLADARKKIQSIEAEVQQVGDQIDRLNERLGSAESASERNRIAVEVNKLERYYHQLSTRYVETQEKASSMPATVQVPKYRDVRYPVELHHRTARLTFRLEADCQRPDFPIKVALDLRAEGVETAVVHDAFEEYGIATEELQFRKSEEELYQAAVAKLVQVVGSTTDLLRNDHFVLERRAAKRYLEQDNLNSAVESVVRVLLGTELEVDASMRQALEQRGVEDPALIRGSMEKGSEASK